MKKFDISLFLMGGVDDRGWLQNLTKCNVKIGTRNKVVSVLSLVKLILENKYQKFIFLSTKQMRLAFEVRRFLRHKFEIISWIHFSIFHEKTVRPKYFKYADKNLAISSGIKRQLIQLGIAESKIRVIFNPIKRQHQIIKSNQELKCTQIGYVGRIMFEGQKNIKELLDAVKLLSPRAIEIHFFGSGEVEICKRYIEEQNIQQDFYWHGWTSKPWKKMKNLDVLIQTSKFEGFPMVLLESLSYGLPIIAANCPTGPEDIISKENGYLYSLGNTEELASIIDNYDRKRFDPKCVKESISKFYIDNYIKELCNAIEMG
ncbi:glycosyltransferase [Latilactobacillus graminis]|uniref:Glycosyltransferase n=1 Tax=Latilactobacillus graminis TaxID=60519 RepID=A0ABX6C6C2_9LACO|nr:glycosyltransferase [Latilactobacillus graminis]QFP79160.1 glycosyltransferase [Latilactobacillus graminis]